MNIKEVGSDFETVCAGCGEPLLMSDGDVLNFRMSEAEGADFEGFPMFGGFLCAVCNKRENPDSQLTVTFGRLACKECGRELNPDIEFTTVTDDVGNVKGMICCGCSEFNQE